MRVGTREGRDDDVRAAGLASMRTSSVSALSANHSAALAASLKVLSYENSRNVAYGNEVAAVPLTVPEPSKRPSFDR